MIKVRLSRRHVVSMALMPVLPSCARDENAVLKRKFKGINGTVVWVSAIPNKRHVQVVDEAGRHITSPALLGSGGDNLGFMGNTLPIPKSVHVTWREGATAVWGKSGGIDWTDGKVLGDYTIPIASRIPEEVLDYVRVWHLPKQVTRRVLRIKLRLMDDGVLLGWDVEETQCHPKHRDWCSLVYPMAGGDFKEAQIYNDKVVERGWYIGRDGKKIETDY